MPQAAIYVRDSYEDFANAIAKMRQVLNPKYASQIELLYSILTKEAGEDGSGFDLTHWHAQVGLWMKAYAESDKDCTCGEHIWMLWTRTSFDARGKRHGGVLMPFDITCYTHYERCPHGAKHRKGDRAGQGTFKAEVRRGSGGNKRASRVAQSAEKVVQETLFAEAR